jgi:hypothetical protein
VFGLSSGVAATTTVAGEASVLSLAVLPRRQPLTRQLRAAKIKQWLTFVRQCFLIINISVLISCYNGAFGKDYARAQELDAALRHFYLAERTFSCIRAALEDV